MCCRRALAKKLRHGLLTILGASVSISLLSGCGNAAQSVTTRATGPAGPAAQRLEAQGCSTGTSTVNPHEVRYCEFELADGRRFSCNMASLRTSAPTAAQVEAGKACVALHPAASAGVIEAIAKAEACLRGDGLEVKGGPVPPAGHAPGGPEGELVLAGALIAFYADPRTAKRAEPEVLRNAHRFGGKPERRGAVTLLWIRPAPSELRARVLVCVGTGTP